jgi:hypothetical protein
LDLLKSFENAREALVARRVKAFTPVPVSVAAKKRFLGKPIDLLYALCVIPCTSPDDPSCIVNMHPDKYSRLYQDLGEPHEVTW